MKLFKLLMLVLLFGASSLSAAASESENVDRLLKRTEKLEQEIKQLKKNHKYQHKLINSKQKKIKKQPGYISTPLSVHTLKTDPATITFHPAALMAGDYILTYIAGMPVVSSPYLGDRPAFNGSDLIVNISSINQDVRLMMQRNAISRALKKLGYPEPDSPILALSGAIEPIAWHTNSYSGSQTSDIDLATAKLDVAAALNSWVEGYFSFSYDGSPAMISGRRINNSSIRLSKGFVNIGNIDRTPVYFTAGQLFVPFGRYSSSMISSPLPSIMARTIARTVIIGYRHQKGLGFFGAAYGFRSDTTLNNRFSGGLNLGYDFDVNGKRGEIGVSYISSINDAAGMQGAANAPGQFGGFGATVASEAVQKVPAIDVHANINIDSLSFSAEWVSATQAFRAADLSYNLAGAKPQAINVEGAFTFKIQDKPASIAAGYGWSNQGLALGLPKHRLAAVFNVSIWRDTVESIEFRHDVDYAAGNQGSGINAAGTGKAALTNGTSRSSNTITAQLGVYF